MSDIEFACPECGNVLLVDESAARTKVKCPQCSGDLVIPAQHVETEANVPDAPQEADTVGKNINIHVGFARAKKPRTKKRKAEKPSRKLIFLLIVSWLLLCVASLLAGYFCGSSRGRKFGFAHGRKAGYDGGYRAGRDTGFSHGVAAGDASEREESYRRGYAQGKAEGYTSGVKDGRVAGRADAMSVLNGIKISSGTQARDVRKYLGTPDGIERYDLAPCWIFDGVRVYFNGDHDFSVVTHWEGNLQALLDKKLGREGNRQ